MSRLKIVKIISNRIHICVALILTTCENFKWFKYFLEEKKQKIGGSKW